MHFSGKIDRTWASDKSGLGLDDCILTRKFSRLGDHEPPAPPAIRNARARTEVVLSPPSFFFSVFNHTPQNRENIHFPAYQFFFHLLNDFHRSFLSPRSSSSLLLVVPEEITSPAQFRSRSRSIPLDSRSFHTPARIVPSRGAQPCPFFPPLRARNPVRKEQPDRSTVALRLRSGPLSALPLLENFVPREKRKKIISNKFSGSG